LRCQTDLQKVLRVIVGYNHNFHYKGAVYHVQTEDGGRNNPNIVTLLYRGGTILASLKTNYADIIKVDNLDVVVEELMKGQHKTMVRNLKAGDYDNAIARCESLVPQPVATAAKQSGPKRAETPGLSGQAGEPQPDSGAADSAQASLDDVILSYLTGKSE
jgi:hypothetical protein